MLVFLYGIGVWRLSEKESIQSKADSKSEDRIEEKSYWGEKSWSHEDCDSKTVEKHQRQFYAEEKRSGGGFRKVLQNKDLLRSIVGFI